MEKKYFAQAIGSQSACNLGGLINTLSQIMPEIWEEGREQKEGTTWVNQHPIVVLFVEQMYFLANCKENYSSAFNICEKESKV